MIYCLVTISEFIRVRDIEGKLICCKHCSRTRCETLLRSDTAKMANPEKPNCAPDFSNWQQLHRSLTGLMDTRGKTAVDRLERELGGVKGLAKRLHSSPKKGLLGIKDGLESRNHLGRNITPRSAVKPPQSFLLSLAYSFTDAVLIVMFAGGLAALLLGWFHPEICGGIEQTKTAWMEGCGILGTVVVILLISATSDWFRDREFYKLQKRMQRTRICTVVRSGKEVNICFIDIKIGDLCVLKAGTIVPADGVLTQINELITNESIINGGASVFKGEDEDPLVFAGSYVREGSGRFLVTAVGEHTQVYHKSGKNEAVLQQTDQADDERGTLQGKLNKASAILGLIGIIVGVLVAAIIILRFSIQTYSVDSKSYEEGHWIEFVQAIVLGIVIIVIAEPEGLSLAVTITLYYCIDKMHAKNILVRNVDAVEKIGNLTTICCGKTGVLTEMSKMNVTEQVAECYLAESTYRGDLQYHKDELPRSLVKELCDAISINTSYSSNITVSSL